MDGVVQSVSPLFPPSHSGYNPGPGPPAEDTGTGLGTVPQVSPQCPRSIPTAVLKLFPWCHWPHSVPTAGLSPALSPMSPDLSPWCLHGVSVPKVSPILPQPHVVSTPVPVLVPPSPDVPKGSPCRARFGRDRGRSGATSALRVPPPPPLNPGDCPQVSPSATMGPVLVVLLALVALLSLLSRHRATAARLPPGPPPLPLLGNLLQVSPFRTLRSLLKLSDQYGPVFTVWLGPRPVLVLRGTEAVREALVGQAEAFAGRGRMPTLESTFRGYGVVFSDGERWRQLRRFSLTVLRDFGMGKRSIESRIQEEAQELLQEFQKTQGKAFDPTFLLSCAVSNIICSIVFGNRFDYHDPEFLEMMQLINNSFREMSTPWSQLYDMAESLLRFMPGPHRRIPRLLAKMRRFIARRVQDNARTLDTHSPRDFIDAFLIQMEKEKDNPNSEFTMENLELTTLNLFFAGTETVSSTLRFGFLYLMRHPHIEEKVFKEISAVVGSGRAPAIADRSQMPFTEATIHEIQRCSDLIPMNVPHRVTRDTEFRGFLIPRGTDVYPLLSSVLNDAKSFKNPQNFDPGNFLDEQGQFQRNEAFLPFSAGKRLCLGEGLARMELFLFFTTILQNLRLQPLGHPEGVPTTPLESGFANIAPRYELRMLPR